MASSTSVRWEYQEGMQWQPMHPSINAVLNSGPRRGYFSFGRFTYEYDLDMMIQKNTSTGVVRKLRNSDTMRAGAAAVSYSHSPSDFHLASNTSDTRTLSFNAQPSFAAAASLFRTAAASAIDPNSTCAVCLELLAGTVIVEPNGCSGHFFHRDCLLGCQQGSGLKCPLCGQVSGVLVGTQVLHFELFVSHVTIIHSPLER